MLSISLSEFPIKIFNDNYTKAKLYEVPAKLISTSHNSKKNLHLYYFIFPGRYVRTHTNVQCMYIFKNTLR